MYYRQILIAAALMMQSCGNPPSEQSAKGRRVVCIAKQYTEIIYALGAESELVAVDVSSTYPEAARKLPKVGYHRALSIEALLAAKPNLIIHDNNIGPEHVVEQLKKLQVPVKTFKKHSQTINGTDSLIREIGYYFSKEREAEKICHEMRQSFDEALADSLKDDESPRVMVIHFGQASNVYLCMTGSSTAARLVRWAGGRLETEGERSMVPLSAELIAKTDPDIILMTDFGYDRLGGIDKARDLPGIAGTKADKNGKIFRVEEHDLVYLGPRTGEVIKKLRALMQ